MHNKTVSILKKHKLKPLQEVFNQGGKKDDKCSKHDETCKLYCHTCDDAICHICRSIDPHHSHKVSYIDDKLGESNKTTLTQCLSSVRTQRKAIRSALQEVQDSKASLQQQSENALGEIAGMKEHLVAMVIARCDGLAAEVREAEDKGRRELESEERELKVILKKLDAFHCLSDEMILEGTTEEQLSVRKCIVNRMSFLGNNTSNSRASIRPTLGFISTNQEEMEKCITSLGYIHHSPHPPSCTFTRNWTTKPLCLKVKTRNERGNECRGGEKVLAILRPVTAGVPVFGEVVDMRDGTYEVQFVSVPSEKCHLSVTVGGHDVAGSPVEVKVVGASIITAVKQEFKHPSGSQYLDVAVGPDGLLYCSDDNGQVTILNRQGQVIRSFKVKNGGQLYGIALSRTGNVIVSDYENGYNSIYTAAGEFVRQFGGEGEDGVQCLGPNGLAISKEGHIFVTGYKGNCAYVFTEEGRFLHIFGSKDESDDEYEPELGAVPVKEDESDDEYEPKMVAVPVMAVKEDEPDDEYEPKMVAVPVMAVKEDESDDEYEPKMVAVPVMAVKEDESDDEYEPKMVAVPVMAVKEDEPKEDHKAMLMFEAERDGEVEGELYCPNHILVTPNDLVYVTDEKDRIQVFQQNGQFIRQFGNGIVKYPEGIAVTSDGHIVVASWSANKLSIFTQDGQCVHEVTDIGLNGPRGIAVDSDGFIYVADCNERIVVL